MRVDTDGIEECAARGTRNRDNVLHLSHHVPNERKPFGGPPRDIGCAPDDFDLDSARRILARQV